MYLVSFRKSPSFCVVRVRRLWGSVCLCRVPEFIAGAKAGGEAGWVLQIFYFHKLHTTHTQRWGGESEQRIDAFFFEGGGVGERTAENSNYSKRRESGRELNE